MADPRRVRAVMWLVAAANAAAGGLALAAVLVMPVEVEVAAPSPVTARGGETPGTAGESLPPLESFAVIWEKGLPAAPEPAVEPAIAEDYAEPSLPLALMGTAVEEGRSVALLLDEEGILRVCGVGESIGGATVTQVDSRQVVLEVDGHREVLQLPTTGMLPSEGEEGFDYP